MRKYITGLHKGQGTDFIIDKKGGQGNPALLIEAWRNSDKDYYEVIELSYEYY